MLLTCAREYFLQHGYIGTALATSGRRWLMSGRPPTEISGLGTFSVRGRKRFARPPAMMNDSFGDWTAAPERKMARSEPAPRHRHRHVGDLFMPHRLSRTFLSEPICWFAFFLCMNFQLASRAMTLKQGPSMSPSVTTREGGVHHHNNGNFHPLVINCSIAARIGWAREHNTFSISTYTIFNLTSAPAKRTTHWYCCCNTTKTTISIASDARNAASTQ